MRRLYIICVLESYRVVNALLNAHEVYYARLRGDEDETEERIMNVPRSAQMHLYSFHMDILREMAN